MRASPENFGFTFITVTRGGKMQSAARFRCCSCPATLDVNIRPGAVGHPEWLTSLAKERGWDAHSYRKTEVWCPACRRPRKHKNDVDSELKRVVPMPLQVAPAPTATSDQRVLIRNLLDKHFDDSTGIYLDGMDDQKIAEKAHVPRVVVERVREAAYGPIRVDPEIVALRQDLASAKVEMTACIKRVDDLAAKVADIEVRIGRLVQKAA